MGKNNSNEGGGCLGVLGFIAAICCSPGLLLAVGINKIVPINSAGLIILIIVGTFIGFYLAYLLYKLIGAEDVAAVICIYAMCSIFLLLILITSGAAENLLEEVMGDKPYSSMIMDENGQTLFWLSIPVVLFFILVIWANRDNGLEERYGKTPFPMDTIKRFTRLDNEDLVKFVNDREVYMDKFLFEAVNIIDVLAIPELRYRGFDKKGKKISFEVAKDGDPRKLTTKIRKKWYMLRQWYYGNIY